MCTRKKAIEELLEQTAALAISGKHTEWCLAFSDEALELLSTRPEMQRRIDIILDVAVREVSQVITDLLDDTDSERL